MDSGATTTARHSQRCPGETILARLTAAGATAHELAYDVEVDTSVLSPSEAAARIVTHLGAA
jgi:chloramphenicol 3-O-phosphotransferase